MAEIKFELRTRKQRRQEFWTISYDSVTGQIQTISPGQDKSAGSIVVTYARIKDILAGKQNQNDFKIAFNEKLGAIDLVDLKNPSEYKKKQVWRGWLSAGEFQSDDKSPLKITLFTDTGILRVETSRAWSTDLKEKMDQNHIGNQLSIFISDEEDPHMLFDNLEVELRQIVDRGYYEVRLWSFMDHDVVKQILYHGQKIRMNVPPVAESISFTRSNYYYPYSGVSDEQAIISHPGPGKHISVFLRNGGIWARSHYEKGSPIDAMKGNLTVALVKGNDPEYFHSWAEFPALMLRQEHPFELVDNWPYAVLPQVLYKANNLDIGVLSENTNQ